MNLKILSRKANPNQMDKLNDYHRSISYWKASGLKNSFEELWNEAVSTSQSVTTKNRYYKDEYYQNFVRIVNDLMPKRVGTISDIVLQEIRKNQLNAQMRVYVMWSCRR